MELQRDLKREAFFRKSSILVLVAAVAVQIAVSYAQYRFVPGWLEIAIRSCAILLGLLASPLLLLLGCRSWTKRTREKLSDWRNGLGLSSMVLVSSVWMIQFGTRILSAIHPFQSYFFNPDWMATLLYTTMLAALLAFALKGTARLFMFSAALLMLSSLQSGIYFARFGGHSIG